MNKTHKVWIVVEAYTEEEARAGIETEYLSEWPWFDNVADAYVEDDAKVLKVKSTEAQTIILEELHKVVDRIGTANIDIKTSDILARLGITYIKDEPHDPTVVVNSVDLMSEEINQIAVYIGETIKALELLSDIAYGLLWGELSDPEQKIISPFTNPHDLLLDRAEDLYMVEVHYILY